MSGADTSSTVRIALLFPELLGTYGDGGNAVVLAKRLSWRGIPAEIVTVAAGSTVPDSCDLYLLGGGEDGPQVAAANELGLDGPLHRAVAGGAVLFAVCAGMQITGRAFLGADGQPQQGLGLLDCVTRRTSEPRAVGELVVEPDPLWGLERLTGFENHGGRTKPGATAQVLGRVTAGVGNGSVSVDADGQASEGILAHVGDGWVLGTYLHGPALARNPSLADLLLRWTTDAELAPLPEVDDEAARLRADRFVAIDAGRLDGVAHKTLRDRILRRN